MCRPDARSGNQKVSSPRVSISTLYVRDRFQVFKDFGRCLIVVNSAVSEEDSLDHGAARSLSSRRRLPRPILDRCASHQDREQGREKGHQTGAWPSAGAKSEKTAGTF